MIRRAQTDADRELCAQIFNTLNPATPSGLGDFFEDPCLLLHGEEGYAIVKPSSLDAAAFKFAKMLRHVCARTEQSFLFTGP